MHPDHDRVLKEMVERAVDPQIAGAWPRAYECGFRLGKRLSRLFFACLSPVVGFFDGVHEE